MRLKQTIRKIFRSLSLMNGYRIMRVLVFFDLPTDSPKARKDYRIFRKFLINEGFLMLQFSVYHRMLLNSTNAESLITKIRRRTPGDGYVSILKITERQFARMEFVAGDAREQNGLDSSDRLVIL